jgi:hypothetical protein
MAEAANGSAAAALTLREPQVTCPFSIADIEAKEKNFVTCRFAATVALSHSTRLAFCPTAYNHGIIRSGVGFVCSSVVRRNVAKQKSAPAGMNRITDSTGEENQ